MARMSVSTPRFALLIIVVLAAITYSFARANRDGRDGSSRRAPAAQQATRAPVPRKFPHDVKVERLLTAAVPEIQIGVVTIVASVRRPGKRTKLAVSSRDPDVDPIRVCVGDNGSRIQKVVEALHGERVDLVPFDGDDVRFVCNAIAPAGVEKVIVDDDAHAMELFVPDDKVAAAPGKDGANIDLAQRLTLWKLTVRPVSSYRPVH